MTTETEYTCDECKEDIPWEKVAYLGGEGECSPFMHLDCYCRDCYEKIKDERRE